MPFSVGKSHLATRLRCPFTIVCRGPAEATSRIKPTEGTEMRRGLLRMRQTVQARVFIVGTVTLMSVLGVAASANAQVTVGGHVGFVIPWVTAPGSQTQLLRDRFP